MKTITIDLMVIIPLFVGKDINKAKKEIENT